MTGEEAYWAGLGPEDCEPETCARCRELLEALEVSLAHFRAIAPELHYAKDHVNEFANCGFYDCIVLQREMDRMQTAIAHAKGKPA